MVLNISNEIFGRYKKNKKQLENYKNQMILSGINESNIINHIYSCPSLCARGCNHRFQKKLNSLSPYQYRAQALKCAFLLST